MALTYFNFNELWLKSRKDMAAIIILTYGLTIEYNELSAKSLLYRLKINHIPSSLFQSNLLTQYRHSLVCNYKTKDPQSYFINSDFLYANASARSKAVYLKALSLRRISDKNNYIPLKYFENIKPNPFLRITEDRIYFPYESF